MFKKGVAEFVGTFTLVLLGCGAAVIAGDDVGVLGIAMAFGLALIGMAYGIGPISGCHINPAVSVGMVVAGRMPAAELPAYVIGQLLGAVAAALVLLLIVSGKVEGYDVALGGLGQNGWGPAYGDGYGMTSAFVFEVVATFLFVVVILGSTQEGPNGGLAGIAIGLTLVVIHIVGINVTGVSVNPARSFGPALFAGGEAMSQLWLLIVAPLIGGGIAGLAFAGGLLSAPALPPAE
jgi:aquaporin Z